MKRDKNREGIRRERMRKKERVRVSIDTLTLAYIEANIDIHGIEKG